MMYFVYKMEDRVPWFLVEFLRMSRSDFDRKSKLRSCRNCYTVCMHFPETIGTLATGIPNEMCHSSILYSLFKSHLQGLNTRNQ